MLLLSTFNDAGITPDPGGEIDDAATGLPEGLAHTGGDAGWTLGAVAAALAALIAGHHRGHEATPRPRRRGRIRQCVIPPPGELRGHSGPRNHSRTDPPLVDPIAGSGCALFKIA